ncbi:MAG: hypothetical protein NTW29_10215 [Bacteroidetes bacterium]|nr:hypothetical protein [Bacteroidota bacterium]
MKRKVNGNKSKLITCRFFQKREAASLFPIPMKTNGHTLPATRPEVADPGILVPVLLIR